MIGTKPETLALHRKALDIRRELAAQSSEPETLVDISRSLLAVGAVLEATGKTEEAMQLYEQARATVAGADGSPPSAAAARSALADAERNAGSILRMTSRMDEALRCLTRARDLQQSLVDAEPSDQTRQSTLGNILSDISIVLYQTGKPAEAIATYEMARQIQQRLVDANLSNPPPICAVRSSFGTRYLSWTLKHRSRSLGSWRC